jgi:hypothetical protein
LHPRVTNATTKIRKFANRELIAPPIVSLPADAIAGADDEWPDLSCRLDRRDHVHSVIPGTPLMAPTIATEPDGATVSTVPVPRPPYVQWSPIVAGAFVAAAVSFVLLSFGSGIGFAVASPSSTWRDTSAILAIVGGLWLVLTSLASFGLGGYLVGRLRDSWTDATPDAVEFRDGVHGLLVWGLAILIGAFLALSAARTVAPRAELAAPTSTTAESLLAFELDQLFRSDRRPAGPENDPELRAQAARIITSGLGHAGMAQDDRDYLIQSVQARTGLSQPDAQRRVDQVIGKAKEAIARARHGAVILAFMIACSLLLGIAAAWLAAASGGQHRDGAVAHDFWRRWEVNRAFMIR